MPHNVLVTGPPRSGKTTVVRTVVDRLEERGYAAGGVVCPERRDDGARVGFDVVDLATGDARAMARVDREAGPAVGKYRVDVAAIDAVCAAAFDRALEAADLVVVDEIAPMEVHSDAFVRGVRRALDAERPVLAAIHARSESGFVGEVKRRDDVERHEVTARTRSGLPAAVAGRLLEWLPAEPRR